VTWLRLGDQKLAEQRAQAAAAAGKQMHNGCKVANSSNENGGNVSSVSHVHDVQITRESPNIGMM
jgi:hypothetical protein